MPSCCTKRAAWPWSVLPLLGLLGVLIGVAVACAQPGPAPRPEELPPPRTEEAPPAAPPDAGTIAEATPILTLPAAIRWAIEHNPTLATARKQHGIAAAGIVIANTYPFNPIIQDFVWGDGGPASAGITNRVFNEHTARLDVEWRGQGKHRRTIAHAALSRTDWEIANQEVLLAIQVVRAFSTALHRRERLRVLEHTVRLQEQVLAAVTELVEANQLPRTELLLARTDLTDARAALAPARNLLVVAENDLSRLLGVIDGCYTVQGTLETLPPPRCEADLVAAAVQRRPDLHALELAVKEAEGRVRLEIANRFGNPSVGPAFEYNETSVTFVGMWLLWQLPVLNTRKGDILARQAERARAVQAVDSLHVTLRQDVHAALNRLAAALETAELFRTQTLPALLKARADFDQLFREGDRNATLARVVAIRSRLLLAYSTYLDSLLELSLADADLAAAVGDPSLAILPPRPQPDAKQEGQ